ncbi:MKI67 FHA domain-interacting nucleolar phosphoprotein-like isoform 1-T2 [Salvelinus alpinus]|uniref:MKI67 FHA domain-interacting nucleolar phosphoprotein-like n=1 Tax=Salvelinus alpinus TaxID=8036 RepID=UPI0039FD914E
MAPPDNYLRCNSCLTGGVRLIVTKIVAETMNNYLMGERLIKYNLVPTEVHEELFVGSQRAFKKPRQPAVAHYNETHTRGGQ